MGFWSEMEVGGKIGFVIFVLWIFVVNGLLITSYIADKRGEESYFYVLMMWWFILGLNGVVGFFVAIPAGIFFICYALFRLFKLLKFLVVFGTAETKYHGVEVMSDNKRNELEGKQDELVKQIAALQMENPELMDNDAITKELSKTFSDTSLKTTYDGYFAEAGKRFALRQVSKTSQARAVVLNQMIGLCKQLAEVNRALADLSESEYERAVAIEKRRLREERIRSGKVRETVEKEMEIEDLELDYRKAQLETKIRGELSAQEALKKADIKEEKVVQKGVSPAEKEIQSTKDKIEMMKARTASVAMIMEAMNKDVRTTDNEEVKKMKARMWTQFLMDKTEGS